MASHVTDNFCWLLNLLVVLILLLLCSTTDIAISGLPVVAQAGNDTFYHDLFFTLPISPSPNSMQTECAYCHASHPPKTHSERGKTLHFLYYTIQQLLNLLLLMLMLLILLVVLVLLLLLLLLLLWSLLLLLLYYCYYFYF